MSFKLLIIRFSSIGDIVLTSPVIRCIFHQLKDVEIHFLTKKRYADLVEVNPYIHKVHHFDKKLSDVITELKSENFDLIIDLHNNIRSHYTMVKLAKPSRSFNKLNVEKWLMVQFKINRLPHIHIVDRYLKTVEMLGVVNDNKGLDFFIPKHMEIDFASNYPDLVNGYIAFVIGGTHNTKLFPIDMVISVCRQLKLPVAILGGPGDSDRGNIIQESLGVGVLNLCGKLNLMQSASIVRQATGVISNDTGLMHVAAAFNKPTVSLWGNTIPEFGMYPYMPEHVSSFISEVKGLKCRPCSKLGYKQCPLKHFKCMREQDTTEIAAFINELK